MPITCRCGRLLFPEDDWVGSTATCPACGTRVGLPASMKPARAWAACACLGLGILSLLLALGTIYDLPNRPFPRSISRIVGETRTLHAYFASALVALVALLAAYAGRMSKGAIRGFVRLSAFVTSALFVFHLAKFGGEDGVHNARPTLCRNNLKQIALAMVNYEATHGALPPRVIRDPQGKPLLSWRVALLPFLEQQALYDRFHLDEPWDSPHNRTLIDQIPFFYVCPTQAEWCRQQTLYQVLDGPGVLLDDSKPTQEDETKDRPGETIAVVEAPSLVPWTSPEDLPFRPDRPFPAWEVTHRNGFHASFADGSVKFLWRTMPEDELKVFATRAGRDR